MGILLILAQIVAIVLVYLAHAITLNLWIVFLPGLLFAAMWLVALLLGARFVLDSFTTPFHVPAKTFKRRR